MKLYRLTQKKFADSPFSPIGAKLYGGRWNSKGTEALYFAESESLCALEVFVHVNNDPTIIDQYDLYQIDVPEELIVKLDLDDLPKSWRAIPVSEDTQFIGDEFLNIPDSPFAALQVPSIISPRDNNYVINPHHPKMKSIFKNSKKLTFTFDPRIFK
ncbi:RES family NAD+ phosphorylase (plasmid) [Vibrio sp. SS-MA-C1-2]|uniref:RES family NAD+ phosphorylase n=1 Tax=Vibrio sp. SS-MA-C1-2 TaxID=2908646 RepID=UPI001F34DAD6|nr:RES family NAD+ phosphorylase [Vibrio sp. SS-MA-C1-2]UJF20265.1 RES family NAD+ phosphorylase [Vibrio sp. SS-MA-C1-2]